ncbi:MAG: acyl-CoA thioesterase [Marinifilaceae bacterium]|jgi:acyl-CoA thioester hydrolase|nr:acyl-CoA thioesterase [Marinifilaceae bacterium]
MNFKHKLPIQVRFGDIDLMQHVNNGVQLSYLDTARLDYFNNVFPNNSINWEEEALIVAHLEIDYLSSITMETQIEVQTKISKLGNKSISLEQNICNRKTGDVITQTKQVMVAFNSKLKQSIEVPEHLKLKIKEFEPGLN